MPMKKTVLKDDNGKSLEVDLKEFLNHLNEYHKTGTTTHTQSGCDFYKRVPALGIEENFIKGLTELVLQKETRENFVSSVMCPNKFIKCPCQ